MADFLLELGTEEIPARMIDNAYRNLRRAVAGMLVEARLVALPPDKMEEGRWFGYATPRRLAFSIAQVAASAPGRESEVTGPPANAPAQAIAGFARKHGLNAEQLERRETPKGTVSLRFPVDALDILFPRLFHET